MDVREKLVELLSEKCMETCKQRKGYVCSVEECRRGKERCCGFYADHLIANGVTVQEWISVKERSPEDSGCYLVVYRDKYNGSISIAFDMYVKCNIGEWWESEFACDITKQFLWAAKLQEQEVTHWMPLPQPPKGE